MSDDLKQKVSLSVVIPVYNVEIQYLKECLKSIESQDFRDFELIIVNDGAPKEISDFLSDYSHQYDYVEVLCQENSGVAAARNLGLSKCNGEYVTFVDSDDTVTSDNFRKIMDRAKKDNLDVLMWGLYRCFGDKKVEFSPYNEDMELFSEERLKEVQYKCLVGILPSFKKPSTVDAAGSACAKLYRLDFLRENGLLYTEGLKRAEDMLFNLKVFGKAKRVGYLYEFFYNYRQLASSATYQYRPNGIEVFTQTLKYMREYLECINADDEFMQVFYMRCIFFLLESMDMDYNNPSNTKPFSSRRKDLKTVSESFPYNEAVVNLKLFNKDLVLTRKIPLVLLRMRMYGLLMLFYKAYGLTRVEK